MSGWMDIKKEIDSACDEASKDDEEVRYWCGQYNSGAAQVLESSIWCSPDELAKGLKTMALAAASIKGKKGDYLASQMVEGIETLTSEVMKKGFAKQCKCEFME